MCTQKELNSKYWIDGGPKEGLGNGFDQWDHLVEIQKREWSHLRELGEAKERRCAPDSFQL